jgi:hypothetical protein
VNAALNIGSYIGVPIRHGDDRVRGLLCCTSNAARTDLAGRDVVVLELLADMLGALADQAAIAQHSGIAVRERTLPRDRGHRAPGGPPADRGRPHRRRRRGRGAHLIRRPARMPRRVVRRRRDRRPESRARAGVRARGPGRARPARRAPHGQQQPLPRSRRQRRGRRTARRRRPAAGGPRDRRTRSGHGPPRAHSCAGTAPGRRCPPRGRRRRRRILQHSAHPAPGQHRDRHVPGTGHRTRPRSASPSPRHWSPWPGPLAEPIAEASRRAPNSTLSPASELPGHRATCSLRPPQRRRWTATPPRASGRCATGRPRRCPRVCSRAASQGRPASAARKPCAANPERNPLIRGDRVGLCTGEVRRSPGQDDRAPRSPRRFMASFTGAAWPILHAS